MLSSSRRYILSSLQRRMMMSCSSSSPKPYPLGREHPQRPQERITILRGPSAISCRVQFLIEDIGDLDVAAKHARRVAAWKEKMSPDSANRICNAIIGAMCDAGRSGDAIDLFDFFFNKSKMKPKISCCNLIIKSHCEQGRLDDALCLYTHLLENTPRPDHQTYDLLTKALVDAGKINQALDLLLEGRRVLFNFLEPGMYMNLVRGYLEQGNLDMAYQLRDDLTTCTLRNKIAVLDSVFVEHLFKQGKDEEAVELYRRSVIKDGFTADGTVGNPYLELLLKYGQKKQAWAMFQYMLDNYQPCFGFNQDTVNMMVNECFEMGRFSDALDLFNKANATIDHRLPAGAYRNIITKLCQNGRLSDAETMFNGLLKKRLYYVPDVETYRAMIRAYVESSRVEDAVLTANKMIASRLDRATHLFF
ncbi:unnamed protein product [Eruca vesicaria subsp. sativa]|uniref:Pentatricopeptide repeat-containing protein n=1 Tax=Eruca vesicaria subsp. sativa TaxID=29727 RepID=A0ABC8K5S8_ERUVS|nr:unnamed protein product [Eruca vesicaria subsp. sativa]